MRAQISQDSRFISVFEPSDLVMEIEEFEARRTTLASANTISTEESSPVVTVSPTRTDSQAAKAFFSPVSEAALRDTSPSIRFT